jgi:hypothetical protein
MDVKSDEVVRSSLPDRLQVNDRVAKVEVQPDSAATAIWDMNSGFSDTAGSADCVLRAILLQRG